MSRAYPLRHFFLPGRDSPGDVDITRATVNIQPVSIDAGPLFSLFSNDDEISTMAESGDDQTTATTHWQLAQINVGRLVAPHHDVRVAPFFAALDRVNALAEAAPGFVWRLQGEGGNATDIQTTADPLFIVNMSVWTDADALFAFVYRSGHAPEMARRREYFDRFEGAYQALWWVPVGHVPSIDEGLSRLWRLDRYGPTPQASTFKSRFPAPDVQGSPVDMQPDPWCVGRA